MERSGDAEVPPCLEMTKPAALTYTGAPAQLPLGAYTPFRAAGLVKPITHTSELSSQTTLAGGGLGGGGLGGCGGEGGIGGGLGGGEGVGGSGGGGSGDGGEGGGLGGDGGFGGEGGGEGGGGEYRQKTVKEGAMIPMRLTLNIVPGSFPMSTSQKGT